MSFAALLFATIVFVAFALFQQRAGDGRPGFVVPSVTLKPMPESESLPTFGSVRADESDDSPRAVSPEIAQKMRRVFHPSCVRSVRSDSSARKLGFSGDRVAEFCDCAIDIMIESAPDNYRKEGFEDFDLLTGGFYADQRRELDNASYLAKVTDLERACAARQQVDTPTRR